MSIPQQFEPREVGEVMDSANPLIFDDSRDTLEAVRDYLAELVRVGELDADMPRGRVLSLQVAQRAVAHVAQKIIHA